MFQIFDGSVPDHFISFCVCMCVFAYTVLTYTQSLSYPQSVLELILRVLRALVLLFMDTFSVSVQIRKTTSTSKVTFEVLKASVLLDTGYLISYIT